MFWRSEGRARGRWEVGCQRQGGARAEPEVTRKAEFDTDLLQDDANTAEAPPVKSARSLNGLHAHREASCVYVGPTAANCDNRLVQMQIAASGVSPPGP
jgi:hypothetical protein